MKAIIVITIINMFLSITYAQKEGYVWVFADSAAIDFNSGSPVPFSGTGLLSPNSNTSISESNGQLLFYAGAYQYINNGGFDGGVFNKYNKLIQNGSEIYCNTFMPQATLLLPFVGDTNKFYLFTNRGDGGTDLKIYYSIIDKTSNQDSGSVILKNIPLPGIMDMTGYLYAVRHGNGSDWWLITHKLSGNQFYKYLIDSSGIQGPYIQSVGSNFINLAAAGQMKSSPSGDKLVLVSFGGFIDLFDFDRCTGTLSNWLSFGYINNNPFHVAYHGSSFSLDSRFLYVSGEDSLFQFDLQSANISASKQLIWYDNDTLGDIGQHMLGPDGKIYIAYAKPTNWINNVYTTENMHLSVINSPDSLGLACDFQPYSFYLGGRRSFYGLPNIPDYNLGAMEPACVVSVGEVINDYNEINIYPNPATAKLTVKHTTSEKYLNYKILDISGRQLLVGSLTRNVTEVDITDLKQGFYLIQFYSNSGTIATQKFIKPNH